MSAQMASLHACTALRQAKHGSAMHCKKTYLCVAGPEARTNARISRCSRSARNAAGNKHTHARPRLQMRMFWKEPRMWMRVSANTTRVFVAFSMVNFVFPLCERRAARQPQGAAARAASASAPQRAQPSRRHAAEQQAAAGALRRAQRALHGPRLHACIGCPRRRPPRRPACQPETGTHAPHAGGPPHLARQAPDAARQVLSAQRLRPVTRTVSATRRRVSALVQLPLNNLPHMGPRPRRREATAPERRTSAQPRQAGLSRHRAAAKRLPSSATGTERHGLQARSRARQHVADRSKARPRVGRQADHQDTAAAPQTRVLATRQRGNVSTRGLAAPERMGARGRAP